MLSEQVSGNQIKNQVATLEVLAGQMEKASLTALVSAFSFFFIARFISCYPRSAETFRYSAITRGRNWTIASLTAVVSALLVGLRHFWSY